MAFFSHLQNQRNSAFPGPATESTTVAIAGLVTVPYDTVLLSISGSISQIEQYDYLISASKTVCTVRITYSDGTRSLMTRAERTA